jgi:hypothetical protein
VGAGGLKSGVVERSAGVGCRKRACMYAPVVSGTDGKTGREREREGSEGGSVVGRFSA